MTAKNFTRIDFASLVPETFVPGAGSEFINYGKVELGMSRMAMSAFALPDIAVVKFDAEVDTNIHLTNRYERESTTVDTCIFLNGAIDSDFSGVGRMSMRSGMQNFIYKPEPTADHYIPSGDLKLLHFMIDRNYYINLLSDDEQWSAKLKETILRKDPICGLKESMYMSPQMVKITSDILNCQLSGSLRSIIIEARVIEFLALQLDLLMREDLHCVPAKMKSKDKEALHALRDYLHQNFTRDHSLRSLSREFGLNEFKLKKGFKTLFGTTVFEYLHDLKMDYAKQLLASSSVYVNEVSGMVGYKNPNHFSTAFKRKYGVNPTNFIS